MEITMIDRYVWVVLTVLESGGKLGLGGEVELSKLVSDLCTTQ